MPPDPPFLVTLDDRGQAAAHVARTQAAPFQIAELVEDEQWVIAEGTAYNGIS